MINPRRVKRHFLTDKDKEIIDILCERKMDPTAIAEAISHSPRQIKEYIKCKKESIENKFSYEEDQRLIELFQKNIRKPGELVKYFPNKSSWMIRNRIKLLERRNQIKSSSSKIAFKMDKVDSTFVPLSIPKLLISDTEHNNMEDKPVRMFYFPPLIISQSQETEPRFPISFSNIATKFEFPRIDK